MEIRPFSKIERDNLLYHYNEILVTYNKLMDEEKFNEAGKLWGEAKRFDEEYFGKVPRIVMSCCPYDSKPLVRTFDPFGFDGLWWRPESTPIELPACTHFCVLLGALNFQGLQPLAGRFEVHPGPEVPYIIPRLLEFPGMVAIISQIKMENGYLAYPITYFAEKRPPVEELTAGWARTIYLYKTQLGEEGWKTPNDLWDFDLRPWLQAGKIRWCPPESDNTILSDDSPDQCPYLDLPGERQRMIVQGDKAWTGGLPTGKPSYPLDW